MRFIHTSDWHLGQTLYDFDRTFEHQCFLDWLLETLIAEAPDALLIAGDIFDSANPSAAAQQQFYRFLTEARKAVPQLSIVVIAGNHDSPGRLEAPSPFMALLEATVIGHIHRLPDGSIDVERLVIPLKNASGDIAAWCLAIPFLRPGDVPRVETEGDAYLEGITLLYQQALDVARARCLPHQAIIAMGHCHTVGGVVSDLSERRIVIGGAEALSANIFDDALSYVALGHLHFAQRVGNRDHIRYSGSPLPMSFAEIHYPHQVLRVDLEGKAIQAIHPLPVPRSVELLRIPPSPAPLPTVLETLVALELPDCAEEERPYVEVRVQLECPEPSLRVQIEAALAGKPVRLARIDIRSASTAASSEESVAVSLAELEALAPEKVFARLCEHRLGEDAHILDALKCAFNELLSESNRIEAS